MNVEKKSLNEELYERNVFDLMDMDVESSSNIYSFKS